MKPSKRKQRKPVKKAVSIVNPKEMIDKYLLTRSPMVEQDIMRVLFILYCAKKGISLKFTDKVLVEDPDKSVYLTELDLEISDGGYSLIFPQLSFLFVVLQW